VVSQHSGDRVLTAGSLIDPGTLLALPTAMSARWAVGDWFASCTRRPPNPTFSARLPSRVTLDYSAAKPVDAVRLGLEIDRMPDC